MTTFNKTQNTAFLRFGYVSNGVLACKNKNLDEFPVGPKRGERNVGNAVSSVLSSKILENASWETLKPAFLRFGYVSFVLFWASGKDGDRGIMAQTPQAAS